MMTPGGYGAAPMTSPAPQEPEGAPLETLVQWFEDAEEASTTARAASERDRDYYDNKQRTAAESAELKKRGQPDIIINRIQTKVNYLLGYESMQRADPRGFPRTPQDEDAAAACTDALRYIKDKSDLNHTFSWCWENELIEGYCGVELVVTPTQDGDAEIEVQHWAWDRLFYDPHSRYPDFRDARYKGGVIWLDMSEAEARWPNATEALTLTVSDADSQSSTYDDRPSWRQWATSGRRKRIRIVQMHYRMGNTWHWCIFTKGGKLDGGVSPLRDEDGKSLCMMVFQSAFVDRDNDRYGFVRALIGPQDEINKRRSKALHESISFQTIGEAGAIDDVSQMKAEKAKPDGHIEVTPGLKFEVLQRTPQIQANLGLLQEAKAEIDLMGPNAAMQGKGERAASGRAIMANQQGGQIEIAKLIDGHQFFKMRVYKLIWAAVRQYWTAQKWVRVTDDEKNTRFVGLNKPVTLAEEMLERAKKEGIPEDVAKQDLRQRAQDPFIAHQLQQPVKTANVPAQMEMDIILEEVPDSANIQQEQFEILAKLAQAGIQFPPKVYIQASALRDKQKLIEMLDEAQQSPAQQQTNQLLGEKATAEIEKIKAEIEKTRAMGIKALAEADAIDGQFGQIVNPEMVDATGTAQPNAGDVPPDAMHGVPMDDAAQQEQFQPTPLDQVIPEGLNAEALAEFAALQPQAGAEQQGPMPFA